MNAKKLLIITTGGTIASLDSGNGLSPALSAESFPLPENAETVNLFALDSTDLTPPTGANCTKR